MLREDASPNRYSRPETGSSSWPSAKLSLGQRPERPRKPPGQPSRPKIQPPTQTSSVYQGASVTCCRRSRELQMSSWPDSIKHVPRRSRCQGPTSPESPTSPQASTCSAVGSVVATGTASL